MKRGARLVCAVLAIGGSLLIAWLVFRGHGSHALTVAWLLSLLALALATRFPGPGGRPRLRSAALLLLVAALPVLVRAANMDRDRLHLDEYLTGYFSATHDFAHTSFFGYMPERWEWQGQFPKPFFFLQRLFFDLFGKGPFPLHLSVQLYVAIVSVMLFRIVREMLDSKSALVAVLLYSFFAPGVYLETLGFMFVSSTAIFTVFFYFALREFRTGEMFHAAMAGIACGFCYLTYYSSYLALPMLIAFFALHWLRERSVRVVENFAIALGGVFVVIAPFAASFFRAGDYVSRRSDEISLLHGAWSPYRDVLAKGEVGPLAVLRDNLVLSFKSFFRDGIGGHGGYDFGHLAFFDRFSLVLFGAGALAGLVLALRRSEILLVFLLIGAAFMSGMVMTIPPPAYHRFSIAIPFVVILMTLPFSLLLRFPKLPESVRYALAVGFLLVFVGVNQRRFTEAVFRDQSADDLRLAELLQHRYGGRNLYVAAFPAFGFEKVLYFRGGWKGRVETRFHDDLLKNFNRREKYVYVMIFGGDFQKRFEEADPSGRYSRFSTSYSLFAN
jgi:Dolichyl-phosphate-mannose-protein mannosyltransferase